jgi:DNA (cytosine-5)-methyltransferase 1
MTNPQAWSLKDLAAVPSNGIRVMSTFACGGGSSMGYKLAGCDVVAANDIDPEMAFHYKLNLAPKHYFLCPIRDLLTIDLPKELFGIDILDGSPPCSTFSMAGSREEAWGKQKHFREGQATQVLSDLFFDYLDLVGRLKPKVAIAENVKGMILGNAKGYTKLVMQRFRDLGYRPQLFLINAADCGVPQKRERVFFCAIREDLYTHQLTISPSEPWVAVGAATADIQCLTAAEQEETAPNQTDLTYWSRTPNGSDYGVVHKQLYGKDGFWNHKKLDRNEPSLTLTATHDMFNHWDYCRKLTFREFKRLGSFPDDYQAKTDKIGKYMVGMSVPPKMTAVVAREICRQWLGVNDGSRP